MHPFNVIVRPILSEKSNELREAAGQYVFEVKREATKQDVSRAVNKMWNVDVKKVTTLVRRGKVKRRGSRVAKHSNIKHAYVTLAKGQKLPLFEDQ